MQSSFSARQINIVAALAAGALLLAAGSSAGAELGGSAAAERSCWTMNLPA